MMLLISAFPQIDIEEVVTDDGSGSNDNDNNNESISNTGTVSSSHSEVKVSERMMRLSTEFVPSDVAVLIKQNLNTRQVTLKLTSDCRGAHFIWEDWVNAMIGLMKGMILHREKHKTDDTSSNMGMLPLQRANLREPMLELCPLYMTWDDTAFQTKPARIWTGWPPFDWRVCQFEVDQWLSAFGLDLSEFEEPYAILSHHDKVLKHAECNIKSIIVALAKETEE